MRALLIAAAILLSACTTAPAVPVQAAGQGNITGFATLAVWGAWESELAPAYTRLSILLHRTARARDARKITLDTAVEILGKGDLVRGLLDASRRGNAKEPTLVQRAQFAEAQRLMDTIEPLLEKRP